jgi:hypothetical protein
LCIKFDPFSECFQELIGRSIIETPLALFEEQIEVFCGYPIVFSQVAFRLVPEVLDTVDVVIPVRKQLAVVDPEVMEIGDVEHVIAAVAVS